MTVGPEDAPSARDVRAGEAGAPRPRDAPADGPPGPAAPLPPGPVVPHPRLPRSQLPPRPRIVEEPAILGLSRLTRGRFGSRLFTLFFVLVFTVIVVQMIAAILDNAW